MTKNEDGSMPGRDPTGGRRVVITAGAASLGLAIARRFHADGARVAICDVDEAAIEAAVVALPGIFAMRADVGSETDVAMLFAAVSDRWGGIDTLVNNAGIAGPIAATEDIDPADWARCIAVNLTGPFLCTRAVLPAMKKAGSGCIVNIVTASIRTGMMSRSAYVASKAGLAGLTLNVAREAGPHNIRCNAVLPGMIEGPRAEMLLRRHAEETGLPLTDARVDYLRYVSMRTTVDPAEVADMVAFLASDAARHVTGQQIGVCGNMEWEA